ncbi:thioredoxin family protein [Mammaliicoccus sp. Dog046]|uniref:thioredoxin family protein n=1 Tax=Mammaliicoccus sp. Dog046 TaxID=3034233 RepID=UPI002B258A5B|nr:thioredoxin family protein [Mammaliicoccus sp. Dog046]WQK84922.1 thioredoxin family protein [Mammaliicoccus sp. Dog046]
MTHTEISNDIYKHFDEDIHLLFGYTPTCGTCKISERMLDIANQITQLPINKSDLNFYPEFCKDYEIQSVPVLFIMKQDKVMKRIYAFQSVPFIVENIQKVIDAKNLS